MENIRITSGIFRGRMIRSPKSSLTHPMGSREKIALFNMIAEYLSGARVLDAFAGSGALGIEALSRGASEVVFVEKNAKIALLIRDNLRGLGLESQTEVIISEVGDYSSENDFDLIIADPPYDRFEIDEVAHLVESLRVKGLFVLSHPDSSPVIPGLKLVKTRQYAGATISIYSKDA